MSLTQIYALQAQGLWEEEVRELSLAESGKKEQVELTRIYSRYPALFLRRTVNLLLSSASLEERETRHLAEFSAFRYLRNCIKELDDEISNASLQTTIAWDNQSLPYRALTSRIAREANSARRHELEEYRLAEIQQLNPLYEQRWTILHQQAKALGFSNYTRLCNQLRGLNLDWLRQQACELLDRTESIYCHMLYQELVRIGVPLDQAATCDLSFLFRAPHFDVCFPKENLVSALKNTLRGVGIDLEHQPNIELDLEARPNKSPRPFCAAVRVPPEIKLVINPRGGQQDYRALFHEAGHAQHCAHTGPDLPFAFRCLGDDSVGEGYAFLFENLTQNPIWHARILGGEPDANFISFAQLQSLYHARRVAAKVLYETQMHAGEPNPAQLYVTIMQRALGVRVNPEPYLSSIDDGLYCAQYLRALMLEAQLRNRLEWEFSDDWFANPAAGDFLRGLWQSGQQQSADELANQISATDLNVRALEQTLGPLYFIPATTIPVNTPALQFEDVRAPSPILPLESVTFSVSTNAPKESPRPAFPLPELPTPRARPAMTRPTA